jgi:hypothetical protein
LLEADVNDWVEAKYSIHYSPVSLTCRGQVYRQLETTWMEYANKKVLQVKFAKQSLIVN